MADLRRIVSTVVVASFSLAALIGIVALLSGGDFGETETDVLLTTVIVGVESVALLCYLAAIGRPFAAVAYVGAPISLLAAAIALYLTWGGDDGDEWDLFRAFAVLLTLAASLAQASLLLALTSQRRTTPALVGTLAAITVVAIMVATAIVDEDVTGDAYWRTLGVAAILDVLGTVVLTATSAFRRQAETPAAASLLTPEVEHRLVAAAQARGTTPSELVSAALDAYLS